MSEELQGWFWTVLVLVIKRAAVWRNERRTAGLIVDGIGTGNSDTGDFYTHPRGMTGLPLEGFLFYLAFENFS
jgi:hypothetical protein